MGLVARLARRRSGLKVSRKPGGPFHKAFRKGEALTPEGFGARHLAAVGFVIQAQQVEQAVQHQDANLIFEGVAEHRGLFAGPGGGYGYFTDRLG